MTDTMANHIKELTKKIKGINDKTDYPLSNRIKLNLSKEEVDTIIFALTKLLED